MKDPKDMTQEELAVACCRASDVAEAAEAEFGRARSAVAIAEATLKKAESDLDLKRYAHDEAARELRNLTIERRRRSTPPGGAK